MSTNDSLETGGPSQAKFDLTPDTTWEEYLSRVDSRLADINRLSGELFRRNVARAFDAQQIAKEDRTTGHFFPEYDNRRRLHMVPRIVMLDGDRYDLIAGGSIISPEAHVLAQDFFLGPQNIIKPGALIAGELVTIGSGNTIGRGAVVKDSMIENNTTIGNLAIVKNSQLYSRFDQVVAPSRVGRWLGIKPKMQKGGISVGENSNLNHAQIYRNVEIGAGVSVKGRPRGNIRIGHSSVIDDGARLKPRRTQRFTGKSIEPHSHIKAKRPLRTRLKRLAGK